MTDLEKIQRKQIIYRRMAFFYRYGDIMAVQRFNKEWDKISGGVEMGLEEGLAKAHKLILKYWNPVYKEQQLQVLIK